MKVGFSLQLRAFDTTESCLKYVRDKEWVSLANPIICPDFPAWDGLESNDFHLINEAFECRIPQWRQ